MNKKLTFRSQRLAMLLVTVVGASLLLILVGVIITAAAPLAPPATYTLDVGYLDFSYGLTPGTDPTGEKPESKLWWNDGFWWTSLWNDGAVENRIYRLNWGTQIWEDTGVAVDDRPESRSDALYDELNKKLYIASHFDQNNPGHSNTSANWGRVYRYSYDEALQTYTLDSGFPTTVNEDKTDTLVMDKESSGRLWASYVTKPQGTTDFQVFVNATVSPGLAWDQFWGMPFSLGTLFPNAHVSVDDISSVVAFSDTVGVLWSNQLSGTLNFAVHDSSSAVNSGWTHMTATLPGPVDDHMDLKVLESGGTTRLFSSVKLGSTSPLTAPLIGLVAWDTDGTSSFHEYSNVGDNDTRPIVVIDEDANTLYVFVTGKPGGSYICFKSTAITDPLANMQFAAGDCGTAFIRDVIYDDIDSVTASKHNVNNTTGLVVMANDGDNGHAYVHNAMGDPPPVVTNRSPTFNETGVLLNSQVVVEFSKPINQATLTGSSFKVANNSGTVAGAIGYDTSTRIATFTPSAPLTANSTYTVTVSDSVQDTTGNALFKTQNWTFSTLLPKLQFAMSNYSVGETEGTATITVTLDTTSITTVTVDYDTSDDSAVEPGDYTAATGDLTFSPGITSQSFEVTIIDDSTNEANENINLTLSNPTNAHLASGGASAVLTIVDNEGDPTIQFAPTSVSIEEDAGSASLEVTLSLASAFTVTTDYATIAGTAQEGADYISASGTITFTPGETSTFIPVSILDDAHDELDETIHLTLSDPVSATLGIPGNEAVITILDDDLPPVVTLSSSAFSVLETAESATITATINVTSGLEVAADYSLSLGTATPDTDYTNVSGTLTFPSGITEQTFSIPIIADGIYEPDETVGVNLSNPMSATLGIPVKGLLTIVDDEITPTLQFSAASYPIVEDAGPVLVTATLSGPSAHTIAGDVTSSDGSATAGADYAAFSNTLVFTPGILSQVFDLTIINDLTDEGDETVILTLSNPDKALLGTPVSTTVVIQDEDPPPEVQFSNSNYEINEAGGSALITATLSISSELEVTVGYTSTDGTAMSPGDYTAITGTLTFSPGETTASFSVPINDDGIDELGETVSLMMGNPSNATLAAPYTATLTIIDDDDPPLISLGSDTYTVGEETGPAVITATLSGPSELSVTVVYTASDGTASSPGDYTAGSSILTFDAGQTTKQILIPIVNDDNDEPAETVNLVLGDPGNATLGSPATAVLTIQDDDDPPFVQFSNGSYSANEGDGSVAITVTLSVSSAFDVAVDFVTVDGTALTGSDFVTNTGTLFFTPGQLSKSFEITLIDDGIDEPQETIGLALFNLVNGQLGTPDSASVLLDDNDEPPLVQFSEVNYAVSEGAGQATITATLSISSGLEVTVGYTATDGTAMAPDDFTAISGTLTFSPGETTAAFSVLINNDSLDESDESVSLSLFNPVNATLATPNTATLTILDNDTPPLVSFSGATYTVGEGSGPAVITATLSGPSELSVTVVYTASDGTASSPGDYTAGGGLITFDPGQTTKQILVPIVDDEYDEPAVTVNLELGDPGNATLGSPATAVLTIQDDDDPPFVQFSNGSYPVGEGDGSVTITVTLSISSAFDVAVDFVTVDGTAIAGSDFVTNTGTLFFTSGQLSKSFEITLIDDGIDEPQETVGLALFNLVDGQLGSPGSATILLNDNDGPPLVQFSEVNYAVSEGVGLATITATLNIQSGFGVAVDYASSDGSAIAPDDYSPISGTMGFTPGETTAIFTVPIIDDGIDEQQESLGLLLSNPQNASLGSPNQAVLLINDNDGPPTVQFSSGNYFVSESVGLAVVTATLSAESALAVTVTYTASDGTAIAPGDYTATGAILSFDPGETVKSFTVPIVDDTIDEGIETINLTLGEPDNALLGTQFTSELSVEDDDDPPTIHFSAESYNITEAGGSAIITATLGAKSELLVTVVYTTSDGTAIAPDDFTAVTGVLTFTPGVTEQSFSVPIIDDGSDEPAELVNLALANPDNATLTSPYTATLTIEDNDVPPLVRLSSDSYNVDEGAGMATVTATLDIASGFTVMVDYVASDGTAVDGNDYVAISGTLTFNPGQLVRTFVVPILNDSIDETDESIDINLANPTKATLGTPNEGTLTVIDDDQPPEVQFENSNTNVNEDAGTATITATLSGPSSFTITVLYGTSDGEAVAAQDYVTASGQLTFAPGQISQSFEVPIIDDALDELLETINMELSAPDNASLGDPAAATVTIVDNDGEPSAQFASETYKVSEDRATAVITVSLSNPSGQSVTVEFSTTNGTATAGSDYTTISGTLTFAPGITSQTFSVPIMIDTQFEQDETVNLVLKNPDKAILGIPASATLTIRNDDYFAFFPVIIK